ncbi:amidohydrolase family protein [Gordonia sp. (in: high G+C Gram-positive bacteria)]|uniref:amidohydrolase family protein n=1 Tax=Gordonia sp. (in: high G+C Gram-positive bacteria) TaxID=84139 RepID=UPI003529A2E7
MNTPNRIDIHTHVIPPFWGEALAEHGGDPSGWALPTWSPDAHLRFMDDNAIETSMLSLTAPSVTGWSPAERPGIARRVNEYTAGLVANHGPRFGNLATVPLPDVEAAAAEAVYSLDELHADGVVLLSNYDGMYLGDPALAPLWRVLDDRSAVVFVHPARPLAPLPGIPGPLVDYPFDTTRNAVHMVFNGVLTRYRNVKIILSHTGGFVPYSVLRFCELQPALQPEGPTADELLAQFRLFYFDTALSSGRYAFGSFAEFADPERILFGSDYPYASAAVSREFTRVLDEETGLTAEQAAAINSSNARRVFDRYR